MARYLVVLKYNEKDYAMTITASNEENAIEFAKDECIRVATKATGHTDAQVRENITEKDFHAVQI